MTLIVTGRTKKVFNSGGPPVTHVRRLSRPVHLNTKLNYPTLPLDPYSRRTTSSGVKSHERHPIPFRSETDLKSL